MEGFYFPNDLTTSSKYGNLSTSSFRVSLKLLEIQKEN